jgi:hypothetical protein
VVTGTAASLVGDTTGLAGATTAAPGTAACVRVSPDCAGALGVVVGVCACAGALLIPAATALAEPVCGAFWVGVEASWVAADASFATASAIADACAAAASWISVTVVATASPGTLPIGSPSSACAGAADANNTVPSARAAHNRRARASAGTDLSPVSLSRFA